MAGPPEGWKRRQPRRNPLCWMQWCLPRWLETISQDGISTKARCTRCGRVGMIDSQGNLF